MYKYNVVLDYQNKTGVNKPYMLTNVVGDNENEAVKNAHDAMVSFLCRANRTAQEIIDAISIKSITLAM